MPVMVSSAPGWARPTPEEGCVDIGLDRDWAFIGRNGVHWPKRRSLAETAFIGRNGVHWPKRRWIGKRAPRFDGARSPIVDCAAQ
jgi:hypothetical protein